MLLAYWYAILVDVKGAFLNGEFTNGEKIYMKVPKGMEKHYPPNVVLLLLKCLYGLKQAAMAFLEAPVDLHEEHGLRAEHVGEASHDG